MKANKINRAFDCISFDDLSRVFVMQGESRNRTDEDCLKWIYDVMCLPLVDLLRSDAEKHNDIGDAAKRFLTLVETFAKQKPAQGISGKFIADALVSAAAVMRTVTKTPASPAEVRAALQFWRDKPAKDPLNLAFKHGSLGKVAASTASKLVASSEKDVLSDKALDGVIAQARELIDVRKFFDDPSSADGIGCVDKIMADVQMCFQMFTQAGFENRYNDISGVFDLISEMFKQSSEHITDELMSSLNLKAGPMSTPAICATALQADSAVAASEGATGSVGKTGGQDPPAAPLATPSEKATGAEEVVAVRFDGKTLDDELLEQLAGDAQRIQTAIAPKVLALERVTAVAKKLWTTAAARARDIGRDLRGTFAADMDQVSTTSAECTDLMTMLIGAGLTTDKADLQYKSSLEEWSAWHGDDAAPSVPKLRRIILATTAATRLAAVPPTGKTDEQSRVMVRDLGHLVMQRLRAKVSELFGASLAEVVSSLYTDTLGMRSCEELEQLAKEDKLKDVMGLLLVDSSGESTRKLGMIVRADPNTHFKDILKSTALKWPHKGAINMAKQFVEISRGNIEARHQCRLRV